MCNWCIAKESIKSLMKRLGLKSRDLNTEVDDWDCEDSTEEDGEDGEDGEDEEALEEDLEEALDKHKESLDKHKEGKTT